MHRRAIVVAAISAVVAGGAAVAATRPATPAPRAENKPVSFAPPCDFGTPFTGLTPGTDRTRVTRLRGSTPTRLVAHAGTGPFTLANLRMELLTNGTPVLTEDLGDQPAQGQDLTFDVGDVGDAGRVLAPGSYEVRVSADVTGRNRCGKDAWQHVDTMAGILVVG